MKANVNNLKVGDELPFDDESKEYFFPEMCTNRIITLKRIKNTDWYHCVNKSRGEKTKDFEKGMKLYGFRYHISWLIPVEEEKQ